MRMQSNRDGESFIVSTASRALNPTEQRYSVAEQELVVIIFALEKFIIYVYGHEINLNTDNKTLSFISKSALTSNRISRWILQLQEYNFLADILSRNPASLNERRLKGLAKPRGFIVSVINPGVDSSVGAKIKNFFAYQARDPRISKLMLTVKQQSTPEGIHNFRREVLYSKGRNFRYCRPILPDELEDPVIKFLHTPLGHSGTEKCMYQILHTFHVKNLCRKVRKLISCCDVCQRVKHPNRRFETEWRSCALERYGPLPVGRGGIRYILVCLDVFIKFVKLDALRSDTPGCACRKLCLTI